MRLTDGGYNEIQYNREQLLKTVQRLQVSLPKAMKETGADTVVVTGKSGIALAFALQMVMDFNLVVVRKPGEGSHGAPVEGRSGNDMFNYIILDDFISTGNTLHRVITSLTEYATYRGAIPPKCVGALMYKSNVFGSGRISDVPVYGMGDF